MEPDARIDLHGMTQARGASHAVHLAGGGAQPRLRLVLVVTGKGNPKNDENAPWMMRAHGVLKQMVPRWLNEPELAALIASVQPAHVTPWRRRRALCLFAEKPMKQAFHTITVPTQGPGLYEFTDAARSISCGASKIDRRAC